MALPVILVDSGTGSDSAASGAGPSTALTGTAASTSGTGLVVTLDSGTVLTGVSTTGSDVLYLVDSTSGNRNFGKITATSGSGGGSPTVTVSDAFGVSLSGKSWAIGGKRATIAGTASKKLLDNNGSSGDAKPGWAVEMQSGHAESIGATLDVRCSGDTTGGPIELRGIAGAATRPILTVTSTNTFFVPRGSNLNFKSFDLKDNAVGGNYAFYCGPAPGPLWLEDLKAEDASKYFYTVFYNLGSNATVLRCRVGHCADRGIVIGGGPTTVRGCQVHHCASHGIFNGGDPTGIVVEDNLVVANGGRGVYHQLTGTSSANRYLAITRNTIDGNTSHGLEVDYVGAGAVTIADNLLTTNGGYGMNLSGGQSDATIAGYTPIIKNNNTGTGGAANTSGAYHSSSGTYAYNACPWATGDPGVDPSYTSGSDWTPTNTTTLKVASSVVGYP